MLFTDYVINRLTNLAKQSTLAHKHGAVILWRNEIVSEGINHLTSPFMANKNVYSVHAEIDALRKLKYGNNRWKKNKKFVAECVMLVVRIGPPSEKYDFKLSKPCAHCTQVILQSGIRKVFYS